MFISVTVRKLGVFRRWIPCEVLYWFCLYQVQTLPASKKGQHVKDFAWFCEFLGFHDWRPSAMPQGFLSTLKHVPETLKLTLCLWPGTQWIHACLSKSSFKDKWKLNAGILLHHNFTTCKGFSWITSGPPHQKEGNSCRYMSTFQYEIEIFSLRNWTMHILDQVFPRKKCGLYIEKANQWPVFSLHAIQLNTFTWSEAVTKLKYLSR